MSIIHSASRQLTAAILCYLLVGCAGYKAPTAYVNFPEYGYLPVIENRYPGAERYKSVIPIYYVAYDWYPSKEVDTGIRIGDISMVPRGSLPQSEGDATKVVEQNFSLARRLSRKETIKEVVLAPIVVPVMIVMWAPGIAIITEYYGHSASSDSPLLHEAEVNKSNTLQKTHRAVQPGQAIEEARSTVQIRVVDRAGRPIPSAEIVLLYSPIRFTAYAGEDMRRLYPQEQVQYDFQISSKFATTLAHHIGIAGAPDGTTTGPGGEKLIELTKATGASNDSSGLLHILVKKEGYAPQARTIAASSLASKDALAITIVLERETVAPSVQKFNPWTVAQDLERQVQYYLRKYDADPSWKNVRRGTPPLSWEQFEEYTLAAIAFAPDYPVVQSAMFFYEVEKGRPHEARKYGRFINNEIYTKAIYHMEWLKGLPM